MKDAKLVINGQHVMNLYPVRNSEIKHVGVFDPTETLVIKTDIDDLAKPGQLIVFDDVSKGKIVGAKESGIVVEIKRSELNKLKGADDLSK